MAKKKKEVPKKILDKIEEAKKCNINMNKKENSIIIDIEDHEVYQYLRHRRNGYRMYDPLHAYKKVLEDMFKNLLIINDDINELVKENFNNAIDITLIVECNPVNNTDSIKKILYKLLGKVFRVKTPDTDNFQKTIFDIMNDIFWKDDAQIVKINAEKKYSYDFKDKTYIKLTYHEDHKDYEKGSLTKEEKEQYKELIEKIKMYKERGIL
ncbi:holliday junction resolvase [Staphylococcus phage Machias]|nr:holliday junction resolvase [Staphylococcus phage Machias]